ncbi:MAG: polysaccharide pyruvyl transferase family protein [Polyangiales bacterium]
MMRKWLDRLTDPDRALQAATAAMIEATGVRYALDIKQERWAPGKPLKLLLAGYVGARNTGADLRVEELIRQLRTVLGDEHVELTAMTFDPARTAGYFRTVRQVEMPQIFPPFLAEECPKHHGVVACEGSMFKSKFANALSTLMAGSLGMAAVEGKLSVGYGAEAGDMDEPLARFVRKHCAQSLVICRNEPSRKVLGGLGIRTKGGTDTAWTFDPAAPEVGAKYLRDAGWDGVRPVLIVCPINPFWWPATPDLVRASALNLFGEFRNEHYRSIYFYSRSDEEERRLDTYLRALAKSVRAFVHETDAFVACVGMEALDREACERFAELLPQRPPLFCSDEYDMYQLVSILRQSSLLLSSRFHAIVSSLPAGVPSVGVTMDERIANLLSDAGHPEHLIRVDNEDLAERSLLAMRDVFRRREQLRHDNRRFVLTQLRMLAQMGMDFEDELLRVYPDFPRRQVPRTLENYLPKLSPALRQLLESYA